MDKYENRDFRIIAIKLHFWRGLLLKHAFIARKYKNIFEN
jgi:hypothetical protein